ncbi:MAG: hypothetical protein ABI548_27585 [Polyangiaceae bacterium]
MRLIPLSLACAALGLLPLLGCSSSKRSDDGKSTTAPLACSAPGYAVDAAPVKIDEVDAIVNDGHAVGLAELPVQVCGIDQCFNGTSGKDGKTVVAPHTALTRPAFKYGDGFEYAELAVPLGVDATQDLGPVQALQLPDFADGAPFPKSGAVTNGEVTLTLAKGTDVEHDRLTYEDDADLVFRSTAIPLGTSAEALALTHFNFELGYAVAPLGTTFCPAAQVSLPNSQHWRSGTEVEVFIQGLDVAEEWAPYGTWVKVAEGSVSADGASINTSSGGIPILSSIAVRRK